MFSTISCPYHPDSVVCLDELVPDLMMTDLPRHLLVERCDFSYRDDAASRLGGGGAGEVFRGELRNSFVAVKTFHSTRALRLVQIRVAVLCHLQHPCVVRLLGVCLRPLCFLLELAPHGSLASVMEDITLGRRETEKEHVASALWYLHDSDIIYRDLKTDNVLVWSLHDTDLVNVKLSDYGISCFATPQGVAGDEGTP
ncbi:predicted protein, partial [Nematostella vectensis]